MFSQTIKFTLIAPCGLNCRLCRAHMRRNNTCYGCRCEAANKLPYCGQCKISTCKRLSLKTVKYCYDCKEFPCKKIKHLDKRYRSRYSVSVVENLRFIQKFGVRSFIQHEKKKWQCSKCTTILCMHKDHCISCGHSWR